MDKKYIEVERTLKYIGEVDWVRMTLERSYVRPYMDLPRMGRIEESNVTKEIQVTADYLRLHNVVPINQGVNFISKPQQMMILEPGDGTRYVVGAVRINDQVAWELGYDRVYPTYLFTFGTATRPKHGMIQFRDGMYMSRGMYTELM